MTSSTPTNPGRRGFTLVEMLVVIGIIVLLIGIALPVFSRVRTTAMRTRMAADLQVIATALEAYKSDFRDYPRLDYATWTRTPALASPLNAPPAAFQAITPGAVLLCWALVGPGPALPRTPNGAADGADGLGFRVRGTTGQVYPSYIATGQFRIFDTSNPNSAAAPDEALCTINDRNGHPILYFPTGLNTNPSQPKGYVYDWTPSQPGPAPTFNAHDNLSAFQHSGDMMGLKRIQMMLGDTNHDGQLGPGETQASNLPYVLWSAGPDEIYGPIVDMTLPDADIANKLPSVDDVTNLQ